ncbi:MAG: hypothetical protein ABIR19_02555 [Ginsengibacter sp.]
MAGKKQAPENDNNKTLTDDLFDVLNPNNMLNNAQRVLSSAVNVLEEEIAAGILAAKKIEKKIINVDDVRSNPQNLLNRIRKDTHEVVDLFLDGFIALSSQLKLLSDNVATQVGDIKASPASPAKEQKSSVSILQPDEAVKPGETAILYMNLSDDDIVMPIEIQLKKNDLAGALGEKIAARNITILPASLVLNPGEKKEVAIHIKVPPACKPGHYTSLFTDIKNPAVKTIINIEVA